MRPHPFEKGKFQVINGHNRLRVLSALNYEEISCAVWELDDQQARLYLATLNRLSGSEVPERRATLLENLFTAWDIDELAGLLPEDRKQLEELRKLSNIDLDDIVGPSSHVETPLVPVILSFMVNEPEAISVNLALDLIVRTAEETLSRGQALCHLAQSYLDAQGRQQ